MATYPVRIKLEFDNRSFTHFKTVSVDGYSLGKMVELMNTTGWAELLVRNVITIGAVLPNDGSADVLESARNVTITFDFVGMSRRITYINCNPTEVDAKEINGTDEIDFGVTYVAEDKIVE